MSTKLANVSCDLDHLSTNYHSAVSLGGPKRPIITPWRLVVVSTPLDALGVGGFGKSLISRSDQAEDANPQALASNSARPRPSSSCWTALATAGVEGKGNAGVEGKGNAVLFFWLKISPGTG